MKKMMIGIMLIATFSLFAGCSNSASGSDNGKVDYAARLLGTWYTPGYDADQYISVTDTTPPPLRMNIKQNSPLPEQRLFPKAALETLPIHH